MASRGKVYKVLQGCCPDEQCKSKLFFAAFDTSIECTGCGQRHHKDTLKNVEEVMNQEIAVHNIFKNYLIGTAKPKKGTDTVKVLGLSNYQCKLLSPLLTYYGMDPKSGEPKLLKDMGKDETFDCSILGDKTFQIEQEHIETIGYGRDRTGSMNYLSGTLQEIKKYNRNQECLLPIHADGDGHCLVHAISRALIGRELFWHALRKSLQVHFETHKEKYKDLFSEFIGAEEWKDIIQECDPEFVPIEGEPVGLRNIHIFGLANVLKRPILLLDSLDGIRSRADYTGTFLPGLVPPELCRSKKTNILRKPLSIAWSCYGRNHYIALVGVRNQPIPMLPAWMVPKCWGMPQDQMHKYMEFNDDGSLGIGGDNFLQDKYILRLVNAMEKIFKEKHDVSPALVADMHQDVYKASGVTWMKPSDVLVATKIAAKEKRLYRCLTCSAMTEFHVVPDWLVSGGRLYNIAIREHGQLKSDKLYHFPAEGLLCAYDSAKNALIPDNSRSLAPSCKYCQGNRLRHVKPNGSLVYQNGDPTSTRSTGTHCRCGFKHFWDGKEYDNMPEMFPITLEWNGQVVKEKVYWFQYESDPSMNSNVYEVAQTLVQKHFPGEFGSERLVQRVVDTVLQQTAATENSQPIDVDSNTGSSSTDALWRVDSSLKTIIVGQQQKTLHKEELTMSQTEKNIKKKIEDKAALVQKRRTDALGRGKMSPSSKPKQSGAKVLRISKPALPNTTKEPGLHHPSSKRCIRVTTTDGQQSTLSLEPGTTYQGLKAYITEKLHITEEELAGITYGFPPKVLEPPVEGETCDELPLQHGDRITVKVSSKSVPESFSRQQMSGRREGSLLSTSARGGLSEQLLKNITDIEKDAGDQIDSVITSMMLMATLQGVDLWTYVCQMPQLFSNGGVFYQQVERDLGIEDGKHCSIPALPGKIFHFNGGKDCLELCAEPLGHFPISSDLEGNLNTLKQAAGDYGIPINFPSKSNELKDVLQSGATGVVVNKSMHMPTNPFSGEGHSLMDSTDTTDTIVAVAKDKNTEIDQHVLSPQNLNIPEVGTDDLNSDIHGANVENMEVVDPTDVKQHKPLFMRVGPGCTVLNQHVECTAEEFKRQETVSESENLNEDYPKCANHEREEET